MNGKLTSLHACIGQLEAWLAQAGASLKRDGVEVDPRSLKEKIEKLYQQKNVKSKDLERIKEMGS